MKINFHNQSELDVSNYIKIIKKVFKKIKNKNTMELIFVTPPIIKELNITYRNINKETDVLSFVNDEDDKSLGDVFINLEQAFIQAENYHHSIKREIAFLAVHGYLHLIGYDHETKEDEEKMFAIQEEILSKAKIKRVWLFWTKLMKQLKQCKKHMHHTQNLK